LSTAPPAAQAALGLFMICLAKICNDGVSARYACEMSHTMVATPANQPQVIGLCRFSYPAIGGFQVAHDTVEARRAHLYAPERLEARFRQFEVFALPSLAAQTDPDFKLILLIGKDLPRPFRKRLEDLVAPVRQIQIIAAPPRPHRAVCQRVINRARDMAAPCLQFRHDDDDAIAITFVERLRAAARDAAPLVQRHRLVGFDFNRGYIARPDALGICAKETVRPFWGVALGMAVRAGTRLSIMNFAHTRLNQFMPTVSFTDAPMYMRGHHPFNDSRQTAATSEVHLPRLDAVGEADVKARFNVDAETVRRRYASA